MADMFDGFWKFAGSVPWYAWVAILTIAGGLIRQMMVMSHKHQERMEMIRQGMDPSDLNKR